MIIWFTLEIQFYLLALLKLLAYLMIIWSKLPKINLSVAAIIAIKTAGLIGNKYTHFYHFAFIFIVIFLSLFWLD